MRAPNPIHPGQMLMEEFIEPSGTTQRELAQKLGWTAARLNELIKGKRDVTAEAALDLAKVLNTTPELWLTLQMHFDLAKAMKRRRAS